MVLTEQRSSLFPSNEPSIVLQREDVVFDENLMVDLGKHDTLWGQKIIYEGSELTFPGGGGEEFLGLECVHP